MDIEDRQRYLHGELLGMDRFLNKYYLFSSIPGLVVNRFREDSFYAMGQEAHPTTETPDVVENGMEVCKESGRDGGRTTPAKVQEPLKDQEALIIKPEESVVAPFIAELSISYADQRSKAIFLLSAHNRVAIAEEEVCSRGEGRRGEGRRGEKRGEGRGVVRRGREGEGNILQLY